MQWVGDNQVVNLITFFKRHKFKP